MDTAKLFLQYMSKNDESKNSKIWWNKNWRKSERENTNRNLFFEQPVCFKPNDSSLCQTGSNCSSNRFFNCLSYFLSLSIYCFSLSSRYHLNVSVFFRVHVFTHSFSPFVRRHTKRKKLEVIGIRQWHTHVIWSSTERRSISKLSGYLKAYKHFFLIHVVCVSETKLNS